jgi:hypothetical protein
MTITENNSGGQRVEKELEGADGREGEHSPLSGKECLPPCDKADSLICSCEFT